MNLTPPEREDFEGINRLRARVGVAAVSTSAVLQAIAEKRAREMAEKQEAWAGHDVYLDLKAAGICTRSQREVSGSGNLYEMGSGPGEGNGEALETEIYEIQTGPKFTVLGDAVVTNATGTYAVEDFAQPC
ncbi:MAG TPA: CAP domain-containing protein [Solirubrobacteraceae bacterium]|nr:CAP domain-containing protein [Solirubrobacteraceae bacterium]